MMRQYGASPRRGGYNPLGAGVIAVGSLYFLQDEGYFRDRHGGRVVCKAPWQVEAFLNGMMHASRRDSATGHWESTFVSGRSDMAVVRSLRDGRRRTIAVRLLILHDELGLTKGISGYPSMPDMRLYRCRPTPPVRQVARAA